jgi:hypothetical protein
MYLGTNISKVWLFPVSSETRLKAALGYLRFYRSKITKPLLVTTMRHTNKTSNTKLDKNQRMMTWQSELFWACYFQRKKARPFQRYKKYVCNKKRPSFNSFWFRKLFAKNRSLWHCSFSVNWGLPSPNLIISHESTLKCCHWQHFNIPASLN